jgi:hypothetical protein
MIAVMSAPKRLAIISALLVVVGGLMAWIGTALALDAIGATIGGFGGVGLISAFMYAIGEGEDRQRAKDEAARGRPPGA